MARKARLEVEGGLYHVITRGNDRQDVWPNVGLDQSAASRRADAGKLKLKTDSKLRYAKELVNQKYQEICRELHV